MTKSCRIQGESVRLYVCPSVCPSIRPSNFERPEPASEGASRGGDVRTYGRTDVRTYRFPLYSTGLRPLRFPPGPLPKNPNFTYERSLGCCLPLSFFVPVYHAPELYKTDQKTQEYCDFSPEISVGGQPAVLFTWLCLLALHAALVSSLTLLLPIHKER